ncbi:MAG: hypothetical protein A2513_00480 [Sulfurimonas sp. RIFOXYD12_FULL_33_39]|uniref:hypothetical protein n=1 Tax=unclassified Sulfurimonas TaxID=2623549 RepID=UPI0008C008B4|nr:MULTISPECIES: hypothetical protein [unclassified Sulfurimonas]OHE07480.1 MAG: hypothetical protein A3G74_01000 [Sulfurimonas sp. RIFCSPLOWO2_12_FULL_34_6]OHE10804.1 MAG: hypothetical protein A2513_00480 [Sulfurimonas sp. RIFOXYD12_FULL_33_39]OHE13426.1 MAG: hypothetical protein A2530_07700 [Sulfurimonas sp. RIFOXYD2_FULL_34_21]DAB28771.1 MAG TPA: hypothetical protein CFH78_00795 [Sulfurimonas sp. UBA10385]
MQCNLELFRNLIKNCYPDSAEKVIKILNSLDERLQYACYYHDAYKQSKKEDWYIGSRANIVAFMQNLHSMHDTLGHLIYYIMDFKLNEREINLYNVLNKIDKNQHETLKNLLTTLREHSDFKYLNDYVNYSKHRHIVVPIFNFGIPNKQEFGFHFDAFCKDNTDYPRKKVDDFLSDEFNREFELVKQIENELIAILEKRLSSIQKNKSTIGY